MPALHVVREIELHVVAEVVEAELVVRSVGDVGGVRHLPLGVVQLVLDDAHGHAQEAIDLAHPLRVAAGEIVVHRDDVDAFAFERVQIGGKRRNERLAFARLHLGDLPLVQDGAADELHVEVPHVQHAAARFAHDRERLDEQIVERLAVRQALAEFHRLRAQLFVAERLHLRLERVDLLNERAEALQFSLVLGADDLGEQRFEHVLDG